MSHLHFDRERPAGSNGDPFQAELLDETDTAIDITGATVTFKLALVRSPYTVVIADEAGELASATGGQVRFYASAANVATAGEYWGEFTVTLASGRILRTPKIREVIVAAL